MTNPKVKLAGKEYEIPLLVPRQQRHVLPALLRAVPAMGKFAADAKDGKIFDSPFPTEAYGDLCTVVYWGAIWPQDHNASPDVIEDMPVTFDELTTAVLAIQMQTGLFKKASEDATPGEAGTTEPQKDSSSA